MMIFLPCFVELFFLAVNMSVYLLYSAGVRMRAWGRQLSAQLLCSLAVTVPELTEVGSVPPCPSLTLQVPSALPPHLSR